MELQLETQENDLRTRGTNKGLKGEDKVHFFKRELRVIAKKKRMWILFPSLEPPPLIASDLIRFKKNHHSPLKNLRSELSVREDLVSQIGCP
jgi:hypothetical protein